MRLLLVDVRHELLASLSENSGRWLRFLRKRVPMGVEADDLLQHALVRAARTRSLPDFRKQDAWFYQILRNVVTDAWHAKSRAGLPLDDEIKLPLSLHADLDGSREGDLAWTCECDDALISGLSQDQAALLRRVHIDGEAVGPVAKTLGMSTSNAYVSLHRARRQLRSDIEAMCGATDYASARSCACDEAGCAK